MEGGTPVVLPLPAGYNATWTGGDPRRDFLTAFNALVNKVGVLSHEFPLPAYTTPWFSGSSVRS